MTKSAIPEAAIEVAKSSLKRLEVFPLLLHGVGHYQIQDRGTKDVICTHIFNDVKGVSPDEHSAYFEAHKAYALSLANIIEAGMEALEQRNGR